MHRFEKKIFQVICGNHLFNPDEKVVVGVSGGSDSTALLLVLFHLQQHVSLSLVAVYVDHGLRPTETPAEIAFLKGVCALLQIRFVVESVDVAAEAIRHKESVEQAARRLRYQVFSRLARSSGATKIAVGHTADDQAEEVVLRLLRGTARAGLSGMKLLRDDLIVRPLLQVTKEEIYTYLAEKEVSFLEDSSNASCVYLRNQVRLEILPFLRKYNPAIDVNLRNLALILQDEEDLLARETDTLWQKLACVRQAPGGASEVEWDCAAFCLVHVALQRRIAEKMFIVMQNSPSAEKIKQLLSLIHHGQGGGQLHFNQGLRVLKKKGRMFFWYPQGITNCKGNLFE